MVIILCIAWQQKLRLLRHNLYFQAGDLYFAPLIPDFMLDYTRKLCPSIENGEKPYCLYFTCKDRGKVPVFILITDQKLHYFTPYCPTTIVWGSIREVGSIPLAAVAQFELHTSSFRTLFTINGQEFLSLPFHIGANVAERLQAAVHLKKGRPAVKANIHDTYLHPERSIDGHDLAEVTNRFLDQFVPLFNFYTSPFSAQQRQQLQKCYGCNEDETPLIHLPLDHPGKNHCGVLITSANIYVVKETLEAIPLAQVYEAGLATVNSVVYLHINGVCQGILYEEHNAFDERNTRVLQTLLRVYRRALDSCQPVPAGSVFPAFYLEPRQHG
jgi:hypothetical protein